MYINTNMLVHIKPIAFLGDSLHKPRDFPEAAKQDAGYPLDRLQRGLQPDDFKPMRSIGKGVEEIIGATYTDQALRDGAAERRG